MPQLWRKCSVHESTAAPEAIWNWSGEIKKKCKWSRGARNFVKIHISSKTGVAFAIPELYWPVWRSMHQLFEYDLKIVNYKNSDRISSIMCLAYVWQINIASAPQKFQSKVLSWREILVWLNHIYATPNFKLVWQSPHQPPHFRRFCASLSMFGAIDDKHNLFSEVNRYVQTISAFSFHHCHSWEASFT